MGNCCTTRQADVIISKNEEFTDNIDNVVNEIKKKKTDKEKHVNFEVVNDENKTKNDYDEDIRKNDKNDKNNYNDETMTNIDSISQHNKKESHDLYVTFVEDKNNIDEINKKDRIKKIKERIHTKKDIDSDNKDENSSSSNSNSDSDSEKYKKDILYKEVEEAPLPKQNDKLQNRLNKAKNNAKNLRKSKRGMEEINANEIKKDIKEIDEFTQILLNKPITTGNNRPRKATKVNFVIDTSSLI